MIEKKIFTAWFSLDSKIPDHIQKCIDSQKIEGCTHKVITLADIAQNDELLEKAYVRQCLNSTHDGKKWVKLTDFVRMWYLYNEGGIFLDADVEILQGRNFDAFLNERVFVGKELSDPQNGLTVLGVAVIGAESKHPMIRRWMGEVEEHFRGDTTDCYESSMHVLNIIGVEYQDKMKMLEPDYFYPYNHFTGKTDISPNTIAIHHFNRTWAERNTLQILKQNIQNNINFVFVKRGDGELACMAGEQGGNCDGHPYSQELGGRLKQAFSYLENEKNATIVEFDNQREYNILLHRTDSNLGQVSDFYKTISNSVRKKILIAPKKLERVARILNAEHIIIPEINAFASYDRIFQSIPVVKNGIYLFCAGMPAKVLIADLYQFNKEATYLDCGSAFDPAVNTTRTFQISKQEFDSLYRRDNFKLAQETHPERMWVLDKIGDPTEKVILDLGCGTNKTLPEALGVDIRAVTDYQASIDHLPFIENETVDIIISRHSLEHVLDPFKTLKEWNRILKCGGKIIIVLPDHGSINTLDHYYGNGEHLHAYTRESLGNFASLFPEFFTSHSEIILDEWSFGTVINKFPKVCIVIPQLGREEGLEGCIMSIMNLNYPETFVYLQIIEGDQTVPEKLKIGVEKSEEEYICYAANDMEFESNCLKNAVIASVINKKGLVSFNEGALLPDKGNICTHFIIHKNLISKLEREEIFCTEFTHCGVDNYLWAQASKLNQAMWCGDAKIHHNHFSKGREYDEVYEKGWKNCEQDRELLKVKLSML